MSRKLSLVWIIPYLNMFYLLTQVPALKLRLLKVCVRQLTTCVDSYTFMDLWTERKFLLMQNLYLLEKENCNIGSCTDY